jgi:predicted enzyme related to lactoylglutathione lyase
MVQVTEIAFIGYPVTDIARARAFYEGFLNLKPSRTFGEGAALWVEYDLGPTTLAVTSMAPEWKPSTQGPSVALEVADFEAALSAARAAGVPVLMGPEDTPVCQFCVFSDPDGNSITLHKRKQP